MDIENLESQLKAVEKDAETAVEEKEYLEEKAARLQDAIAKLQEDMEVTQQVQPLEARVQQEAENAKQQLEGFKNQAMQLEGMLKELMEQATDSAAVLDALTMFGEDVEEGLAILQEREKLIGQCTDQLQSVLEKLGMSSSLNLSESGSAGISPERITTGMADNITMVAEGNGWHNSKGNHYAAYEKYNNSNDPYETVRHPDAKVVFVKARDIEGVRLNDSEVSSPERFWSRDGRDGRSQASSMEHARKLQAVHSAINSGMQISDLEKVPELSKTVDMYFGRPVEVARCGNFYINTGDGRHRTLAAQSIDGYIPVIVKYSYVRK